MMSRLAAVAVLLAISLAGCGGDEDLAEADRVRSAVGDAVKARSEKTGSDITTAIADEPWSGESDSYVTGTYDHLVFNIRTTA